jgi:hypothetical protein
MSEETNNDRALTRLARASWVNAQRGARLTAENARSWARAEDIEALIKEQDARALSSAVARNARKRARAGKRAHTIPAVSAHPMSAHEVKARAFRTRALRSGVALIAPCALIAAPPWMALNGDPGALIAWPAAYAYLVFTGWSHKRERENAEQDADTIELNEPKRGLFRRTQPTTSLKPNAEESAILNRLNAWEDYAAERKLHEVSPGPVVIDESGILIPMTFTGLWTPSKLDGATDQLRALLAIPDEVRTQVKPGGTADRAVFRVRTRIRELDLRWTPEREGIGLDADTGEVVHVDTEDRLLAAGISGAGKSVALRVLMADALLRKGTKLVIIDLKVEGALWSHVARVESEPDGIQDVVDDLVAEMKEREVIMRASGMDMWEATEERPCITVVVDEGAELMAEVPDSTAGNRSLARRARSAGIRLWWATQKPTVTGKGAGLDSSISAQLTSQICMAVASPTEARNVLGEDATAKGWHAEDLAKGGWALIRVQGEDRKPDPVRVWFMTKEDVKAIPPQAAWRRQKAERTMEVPEALAVALHLSKDTNGVSTARLAAALNIRDTEVHARMREFGADPEPNAFAIDGEGRMRGYRRDVLEAALQRWKTT